jgi:hypothetical protein
MTVSSFTIVNPISTPTHNSSKMAKPETKASSVDLSQFEETPVRSLKAVNKADDEKAGNASGQRTANIKLVNGKNTLRFAPKRKGEATWAIHRRTTWLEVTGNEGDLIRRPIEDSIINAGTKFDIISEYLRFAREKLGASKDGQAKLAAIANVKREQNKGLSTKSTYIAYAWQKVITDGETTWHFGEYEFGKAVRDGIDTAAGQEDEEDEISVDPYTSIANGRCAIITQNKDAKKPADYYKVTLGTKPTPLTQEMLTELSATKSLTSKYRGTYGLAQFNQALDGIQNFDAANEIDLCEEEEWEAIVDRVRAQYTVEADDTDDDDADEAPVKGAKGKTKLTEKKKPAPVVEEDDEDEDEDDEEEAPAPKKPVAKGAAPTTKAAPKKAQIPDDEDEDEEDEDDEPVVVKPKAKAAPTPVATSKKKPAPVEEDDDEDDEDLDDLPFDEGEDDDEDDDTPPPPAAKKAAPTKVEALKGTLKKGKKG